MHADHLLCDRCGGWFEVNELDSKPAWLAGWLVRLVWALLPYSIAMRLLDWRASKGDDFDVLECKRCYGPGYEGLDA